MYVYVNMYLYVHEYVKYMYSYFFLKNIYILSITLFRCELLPTEWHGLSAPVGV